MIIYNIDLYKYNLYNIDLYKYNIDLYNIVSSLKYRKSTGDFQKQMKEDISSINSSPNVFIFADKTNNIYKTLPEQYKKDMQKVNSTSRKVNQSKSQKHS